MMHIAFCTDTNYVMPTGVAMTSICENNKSEEITFHLVITDEGAASNEVEKKAAPLKDIAEKYHKQVIVYKMLVDRIRSFVCRGGGYISTTAFSRIFLPELLSTDIKKVLYLDCDLVCDGSLRELYDTVLEDDCPIGAIVDCDYASAAVHIRAQIPQNINYINSGVLLMNLNCWRKNNYIDLAVETAIKKCFPYLDQDVLNNIFCGKIKYLPVKYNVLLPTLLNGIYNCHITTEYYEEILDAMKHPVIIHYQSPNKPWKLGLCVYREVWEKYQQLTIWKNFKPTPASTEFDKSYIYQTFQNTYHMDSLLFIEGLKPYLRFFGAAIRLKNKKYFVAISSKILNSFASVLELIYARKMKQ